MADAPASVLCWTHDAPSLAGNPLGDPTTRRVYVCLPPGRTADDCEGLPLILLLPGFAGRGRGMLADNLYAPSIDDRMTRLIDRGCPPAVLALPDCSTKLGGSQYINSIAVGNYRDYLTNDLVPMLRARLGTGGTGVAGKSSGGYGALRLGMEAGDMFTAIACHSGDCYFEYGYLPDIPKAAAAIGRAGSIDAFLETFHTREKKTSEQIITLSILAMSACYSPIDNSNSNDNGNGNAGYDLPFDESTGAYRPDVFARWLQHDPYRMVEHHVEALQSKALLFIDVGSRDEFHLQLGARLLRDRLRSLGIAHHYEEFDDGHFSTSYRYEASLPLLIRALSAP